MPLRACPIQPLHFFHANTRLLVLAVEAPYFDRDALIETLTGAFAALPALGYPAWMRRVYLSAVPLSPTPLPRINQVTYNRGNLAPLFSASQTLEEMGVEAEFGAALTLAEATRLATAGQTPPVALVPANRIDPARMRAWRVPKSQQAA
jgi:hypothetical protein